MLEIIFRRSLFFWYIKILLKSFSVWDIENVKPKFSLDMLYAYKKKNVWNVKKGKWLLQKIIFETFLSNLFSNLPPVHKNNLRKALFQSAKKIPQNYLKTKLFNIDGDRMNAPKRHLKSQSKMVTLSVKQLLNFINSIF